MNKFEPSDVDYHVKAWILTYLFVSQLTLAAQQAGLVTFNKEVAPILHKHCVSCHHENGPAPFPLVTFTEAKAKAKTMAEVVQRRYMPPWLPEPGHGEFIGERRLTSSEITLITEWASSGALEGSSQERPSPPSFGREWQLGEPDLVLRTPEPYKLASEGPDTYRNFVVRNPLSEQRFVRAYEFRPRNKSVHHVRITLDGTGESKRLDKADPEPGSPGMKSPGQFPVGHMLTWVPGKRAQIAPQDLTWPLEGNTDLVFDIHLQRTGRPEEIQPEIGLYFTNQASSRPAAVIGLSAQLMEIPAGEKAYRVERSFALSVPVQVLTVMPHLHYLGKKVEAFALLPDGSTESLLRIEDWDFNWQSDYRYRTPVQLPKGSLIVMRYLYDNSAENPRNPHRPPTEVRYGPQSTDEMAELWLQVLTSNTNDLATLQRESNRLSDQETFSYYSKRLASNPANSDLRVAAGKLLAGMGRLEEAILHFREALTHQPAHSEALYYLGAAFYTSGEWMQALRQFEALIQKVPDQARAHAGMAMVYIRLNQLEAAESQVKLALQLDPEDKTALATQQRLLRVRQSPHQKR